MSKQQQNTKNITLQASSAMVKDYFSYAMHNVLYQRGVGSLDNYEQTKFYGLNLFVSNDPNHKNTIKEVLDIIEEKLTKKEVKSVLLVLKDKKTEEDLECWRFDVDYENGTTSDDTNEVGKKDAKTIQNEISAVLRQVLGAATVLPLLETESQDLAFQIQAVRMPGVPQWEGWSVAKRIDIQNEQEFEFRSFSTSIHKVDSKVQYKGN